MKITKEEKILCEFCKTTETGITQDKKSKYIIHKPDCRVFYCTTLTK